MQQAVFKQNTENVDNVENQVPIVHKLKSYHILFHGYNLYMWPSIQTDTADAEVSLEISGGCKVVKLYDTRIQVTN